MNLGNVNDQLIAENAQLKKAVSSMESFKPRDGDYYNVDSAFARRFEFKVAKVVNNTVGLSKNYLTIDKGTLDGIEPGTLSFTTLRGLILYNNKIAAYGQNCLLLYKCGTYPLKRMGV
jgi:cell shape-determining protein MreC